MSAARTAKSPPELHHRDSIELPDRAIYRTLSKGDQFTVKGEGRYRLVAVRANDDLNAWGPISTDGTSTRASMRSFRPEQVDTIHTVKRGGR